MSNDTFLTYNFFRIMNEANQLRLRQSANALIQAIGTSEDKASIVSPFLDNLLVQVQNQISAPPAMLYPQLALNTIQQQSGLQLTNERLRIAYRLAGFNPKDNYVTQEITRRFGANLKQGELVNIAQVIADQASIKLDRDAKRRKNVLFKWFEENWTQITPYLDYIVLEDNNNNNNSNNAFNEDEKNDENSHDDSNESNSDMTENDNQNESNQNVGNVSQ
ncbi:hypothetical protein TRFO_03281 [Tritrichomonas foetus]|uniref:Uncharacterized protein n=1 Tax=Tritrichomonas foetus TaxID=1144522 RepID=A0A1J4KV17_9EUKA|nr:hypothetical protein TRFO_03281 [Tritrichomonas foetus]|eukprot:OHT13542.1 hypothetical protein TRFO_03281 [Tritrichomonas foetus]